MKNNIYVWFRKKLQISIRRHLGDDFEKVLLKMREEDKERVIQIIREVDSTFLPLEEREKLLQEKLEKLYVDIFKEKALEIGLAMDKGISAGVPISSGSSSATISSQETRFKQYQAKALKMVKDALLLIEDFPYEHIDDILSIIIKANACPYGNNWETLMPFENKKFPAWYIGRYVSTMVRESVNMLACNGIENYTVSVSPFCPYPQHRKLKGKVYPMDSRNSYLFPFLQFGCDCRFRPSLCFEKKSVPKFGIKEEKYSIDIETLPFHPRKRRKRAITKK